MEDGEELGESARVGVGFLGDLRMASPILGGTPLAMAKAMKSRTLSADGERTQEDPGKSCGGAKNCPTRLVYNFRLVYELSRAGPRLQRWAVGEPPHGVGGIVALSLHGSRDKWRRIGAPNEGVASRSKRAQRSGCCANL